MLVVDTYALQPVDVLHLVNDVPRQGLYTLQAQDVMRLCRAVNNNLALVDYLTIMHHDMLVFRYQELMRLTIHVSDHQTLLALGVFAK